MGDKNLQSRHQIDLGKPEFREMRREFALDRAGIDEEKRTVSLSFASEQPVDRWFGREILDISEKACDLSRLNNGGAVLVNHNWDDQVGVVVESAIDPATKKARCMVKFSRSERGQEIFHDVIDGIRSLVSVGYVVKSMVLQSVEDGVETHRVTEWQPYEVSMVAVPADASVGVGREKPKDEPAPVITARDNKPIPQMTPEEIAAKAAEFRNAGTTAERERVKEINATAKLIVERNPSKAAEINSVALRYIENGGTVDAMNRDLVANVLSSANVTPAEVQTDATIGMSRKDVKRYSILRAIRAKVDGRPLDGLEREASDEVAKKLERQPMGFFLPDEVVYDAYAARKAKREQRTLLATSAPDGGYLVGSELLTSEFLELLRNNTVLVELGARYLPGLKGDVTIPRQLTGATTYWASETGIITASSATFGQIVGRPRRIGTQVPYSKQFLAQSSLGAEAFVINDSDAAIAVELDRVALRGSGGSEPLGVARLDAGERSTSVTFGAAPTWAKYLEFFSSVAANNAVIGSPAYVASVASAVKAMATAKFSSSVSGIWDNDMVGTFRARWTTQLLTSATPVANMVIFGDWSQVLFMEWAGRDVVVDPYGTNATNGTVTVTIQRLMDMVIRRAKSFAISTDSGAQ